MKIHQMASPQGVRWDMLGKFLLSILHTYLIFLLYVRVSEKLSTVCWNSVLPLYFLPRAGVCTALVRVRTASVLLPALLPALSAENSLNSSCTISCFL